MQGHVESAPTCPLARRRGRLVAGALLVPIALAGSWFGLRGGGTPSVGGPLPSRTAGVTPGFVSIDKPQPVGMAGSRPSPDREAGNRAETVPSDASDVSYRESIVGTWTRQYSGTWTMTIREDGTGEMTVVPDKVWSLIVGPKITIETRWNIAGGRVVFDSVRGEPESSYKIVMTLWKAHQDRELVQVDDENLIYVSDDGKSQSKWQRVKSD